MKKSKDELIKELIKEKEKLIEMSNSPYNRNKLKEGLNHGRTTAC